MMITNVYDGEIYTELEDRIFRARLPYIVASSAGPSCHPLPVSPLLVVDELVGAVLWDSLNTPLKVVQATRYGDFVHLFVNPCNQQEVNDLLERDRKPREFHTIELEASPKSSGRSWWELL